MQEFDLHTHTAYCDGKNTAEEMVISAIEKGFRTIGLSGHSYTWFDESYCMSREGTEKYIEEVSSLRSRYKDKIRVLLGTELDYWAEIDTEPYDYLIGSSHYLKKDGEFLDLDYSAEMLMDAAAGHFGGSMADLARAYYEQAGGIVEKTGCDIIGHFDIITKFNETLPVQIVGTMDAGYISSWMDAVDRIFEDTKALRKSGVPNRLETLGIIETGDKPVFEINTGAMAKGYRTSPYPARDQINYIKKKGGILILSSDSHRTDTIGYAFDRELL